MKEKQSMGVGTKSKVQRGVSRAHLRTASGQGSLEQDETAEMGQGHKESGLYPENNGKSLMDGWRISRAMWSDLIKD